MRSLTKKIVASVATFVLLAGSSAFAQESRIVIASDSSSGTYNKMLGEIIGACSSEKFSIVPAQGISGGAPGNLQALVDNKAQAAFVHSDVYFAHSMADPTYNRFQTLVALYPEPIHILALRQSKSKVPGIMTMMAMGKIKDFNTLADLRGYKVGAAGGGVFTARILKGQGDGGFEVVSFDKGDQVITALANGQIDAALFVGAAPLPNILKLDKSKYKLLTIDSRIADKVSTVYRTARVNYPGLTNGPVKTLAPIATILTRKFNTPARVAAQRNFRDCFNKHLDQLKDDGSPNWQQVTAGDHGVLPWYEISVK